MLSQDRSIELPTEPTKTTDALVSSTVRQALLACEQADWDEVIAACQQAIALCNQNLTKEKAAREKVAKEKAVTEKAIPGKTIRENSMHKQTVQEKIAEEKAVQENSQSKLSANDISNDATAAAMYQSKAELCQRQGLVKDAIAAFENAIHHQPQQADLHIQVAALYANEQHWAEAVRNYQRGLALISNPAGKDDASDDSRDLQATAGRFNGREEAVKTALAEAWFKRGEQLKQQGDVIGAVNACVSALEQEPLLYKAYNRLRYNLLRYDIEDGSAVLNEVVAVCEKNIAQHGSLHSAYVVLGYALTKLNRLSDAIASYRQASDFMTARQLEATASASGEDLIVSQQRLAPSFMVIGAEKCGTTSLHQYLARHPQVLASVEKEIDFFDMEYTRGLEWYLAHFPAIPAQQLNAQPLEGQHRWVSGETSANYLYSDVAPGRIFERFPQLQLVVLLRHPVDRTISRYNMMVRNGAEKRSFEQAISEEIQLIEQAQSTAQRVAQTQTHNAADGQVNDTTDADIPWRVLNRCRHVGNSLYYYHLQRWLAHFSPEQLLVVRSEDLFCAPEQTLGRLCETLDISPPPAQAYQPHNAGQYGSISEAMCQRLFDFYQPHTHKLETLLDRSFDWTLA